MVDRATSADTPVLVVGAGPVGLSAAILLARGGVKALVVERHAATTDHPKSRAVLTRTMEILRPWGVEGALRAQALPPGAFRFIWIESLAGREIGRVEPPNRDVPGANSPTYICMVAQDAFEAQLRRRAETYPEIQLSFATELIEVAQDEQGVSVRLRNRRSGELRTVRASYVIAADGASSRVREALGVAMVGPGELDHNINIHFRAELAPWVRARPAVGYISSVGNGTLLWAHGTDRWLILRAFQPARGERPEDFTPRRCLDLARAAVGMPDLPVELINIASWTRAAQVAQRFQVGRVFLAGDAAHRFPPTGGFGANTGIQDVHNLAWKLAAVVRGWAHARLLETYEEERRPIAQANTDFSVTNGHRWAAAQQAILSGDGASLTNALKEQVKHLDSEGQDLGFCYASGALVPDGAQEPLPLDSQVYVPSAAPGARAPHVWLRPVKSSNRAGSPRLSTLDLFERQFVLMSGPRDEIWRSAAQAAAQDLGLPLSVHAIGPGGDLEPEGDWAQLYGLDALGAVLVRPDGHVAWRTRGQSNDALALMRHALAASSGRQT
jgi:putative polyketide hydroxylase